MKKSKESNKVYISNRELGIISSSLIEFSLEMYWAINASDNKEDFKTAFKNEVKFSLKELGFIEDAVLNLELNFRDIDMNAIQIFFPDHIPQKSLIIYTALKKCSDNFEDYEFSIRTPYQKEELDTVLKEFKEKVIDKLDFQTK